MSNHANAARQQSPEHIARRVEATRMTKQSWTEEKQYEFSEKVRTAIRRRPKELQEKFMYCNRGRIPWNKGNNWRDRYSPEEIRSIIAAKERKRRRANPHLRVHASMSAMLRRSLREKKASRSWESLVGFTREQLISHLEAQFTGGMSWENYGKWQLDHILPRSSFAFDSPSDEQFRKCWALSNLQPLWAEENNKKRDRLLATRS